MIDLQIAIGYHLPETVFAGTTGEPLDPTIDHRSSTIDHRPSLAYQKNAFFAYIAFNTPKPFDSL